MAQSSLVLAQVPALSHLTGFSIVQPLYMGHSSTDLAHDPILHINGLLSGQALVFNGHNDSNGLHDPSLHLV